MAAFPAPTAIPAKSAPLASLWTLFLSFALRTAEMAKDILLNATMATTQQAMAAAHLALLSLDSLAEAVRLQAPTTAWSTTQLL